LSIQSDIIDKIIAVIAADVPEITDTNWEKVYLATTDIQDHEIPIAQLWDISQSIEHQQGRVLVTWSLSLELIIKNLIAYPADQKVLLELREKVLLALWAQPNLGIPGVIHMVYNGNVTDLHLLEPHFITRIDFDVLFYDNLTGSC